MEQGVAVLWTMELYLRILLAIDDEIVDREIVHTQEVRGLVCVYNVCVCVCVCVCVYCVCVCTCILCVVCV